MDEDTVQQELFRLACDGWFNEFDQLLSEAEATRSLDDIWEAYLMRAQIKILTADVTLSDDLSRIEHYKGRAHFASLFALWHVDTPNRFNVFPEGKGELHSFGRTLDGIAESMMQRLGQVAHTAVRQMQCELYYFTGDAHQSLAHANEYSLTIDGSAVDILLAQVLRFRCYLALGLPEEAEECLLEMIRHSQAHPECIVAYRAFRNWLNLTTNWGGDTLRFSTDSEGRRQPVLHDRIESVSEGTNQAAPLEERFIDEARRSYKGAYSLRQHYMDILHAMYWHQCGDTKQAELYFLRVYRIATQSGVIMPLVECGEQITPLLHYASENEWKCSHSWLDNIVERAIAYENSIRAYQGSFAEQTA